MVNKSRPRTESRREMVGVRDKKCYIEWDILRSQGGKNAMGTKDKGKKEVRKPKKSKDKKNKKPVATSISNISG